MNPMYVNTAPQEPNSVMQMGVLTWIYQIGISELQINLGYNFVYLFHLFGGKSPKHPIGRINRQPQIPRMIYADTNACIFAPDIRINRFDSIMACTGATDLCANIAQFQIILTTSRRWATTSASASPRNMCRCKSSMSVLASLRGM